jgi:hypothetical protein
LRNPDIAVGFNPQPAASAQCQRQQYRRRQDQRQPTTLGWASSSRSAGLPAAAARMTDQQVDSCADMAEPQVALASILV